MVRLIRRSERQIFATSDIARRKQQAQQQPIPSQQSKNILELERQIKLSQDNLNQLLKERDERFGTSPPLKVRRSSEYKQGTAKRRAERKIIEQLQSALGQAKKGATINLSQVEQLKSDIRSVEKAKTQRAISNLARKTITPTTVDISQPQQFSQPVQSVITKAQQGKTLTVQDFRIARKEGIKENQLLGLAVEGTRVKDKVDKVLSSNTQPSFRGLLEEGFTNDQANIIIKQWSATKGAERDKDLNTTKFWNAITNKDGSFKKTRFVDDVTATQAFKISANQWIKESGFKTVPFTKPVSSFERKIRDIQEYYNSIPTLSTTVPKSEIVNKLSKIINRPVERKALFGKAGDVAEKGFERLLALDQTIRDKVRNSKIGKIKKVKELVDKFDKEAEQLRFGINTFKNVRRNEAVLLTRDLLKKNFGVFADSFSGLSKKEIAFQVYKGIFNIAGAIINVVVNPRNKTKVNFVTDNIGSEALKLFFNYGKSLRTRFESGENNPALNDIRMTLKKINGAKDFVKTNPETAAVIMGAASLNLGANYFERAKREPVTALTEAVIILAPDKVLKTIKGTYVISKAAKAKIANKLVKSKVGIARGNGTMLKLQFAPEWEITFDRAKYIKQLKEVAEQQKKELIKQEKKKAKLKLEGKPIDELNKAIAKLESDIKKTRLSSKAIRLNPETISKGLGNLFKETKDIKKIKEAKVDAKAKVELKKLDTLINQLDDVIKFWKSFGKGTVRDVDKQLKLKRQTIENEIKFYERLQRDINLAIVNIRKGKPEDVAAKVRKLNDLIKKVEFQKQAIKLVNKLKEKLSKEVKLSAGSKLAKDALMKDKKFLKVNKLVTNVETKLTEFSLAQLNANIKKMKNALKSGQLVTKETKEARKKTALSDDVKLSKELTIETTPATKNLFSGRSALYQSKRGALKLTSRGQKLVGGEVKNFQDRFRNNVTKARRITDRTKLDRQRYINNPSRDNFRKWQGNKTKFDKQLDDMRKDLLKLEEKVFDKMKTKVKALEKVNAKFKKKIFRDILKAATKVRLKSKLSNEVSNLVKLNAVALKPAPKSLKIQKPKRAGVKRVVAGKDKPNPFKGPKPRTTPKKVTRPPRIRKPGKPVKLPPKVPKPKLTKPSKKVSRTAYDILYRTKGKVRRVKTNLPLNAALDRARSLIDNTTARSMQLISSGSTIRKDVKKPSLEKFRLRKTKKALILVEKSKFALDTKGEKRGITLAKKLAPKKKKTIKKPTTKKKSSIKRPKKGRKK